MTRKEFTRRLTDAVRLYIENPGQFTANPQLRVNPDLYRVELVDGSDLLEEIEDSDEAIENATISHGEWDQDEADYQAKQNPDFYPLHDLWKKTGHGMEPDDAAIEKIVEVYFPS